MALDRIGSSKIPDCEEFIRQIKDVISARIVTNVHGEIMEVHVLAGPNRSPKQVVRDIESVFIVRFGVEIDHKKISVAQLQADDEVNPTYRKRPKMASVTLLSGGRLVEAKVFLDINGTLFEGSASGPKTTNNKLRLISQATLSALEEYFKNDIALVTEDVILVTVTGLNVVVVTISLVTNLGEQRLIGASFINSDEREAVAKATLAAVNRRIDVLLND